MSFLHKMFQGISFIVSFFFILSTLSPFGTTATDFKLNLRQSLTLRRPPYAKCTHSENCRLVFLSSSETLIQELMPMSDYEQTSEIYNSRELLGKSAQSFKLSPICVHLIIDVNSALEVPQGRKWVNLFITNMKQLAVHFIIVGPKSSLLTFLNTKSYDQLKYKTALTTDTHEVLVGDTGTYTPVDVIPPLPSENQLVNGRTMQLSTWKYEPFTTFDRAGNPIGGFSYIQTQEFCKHYNVTFKKFIDISPLTHPNGSWAGHMYALVHGDSDALISMGLIQDRYGAADFTTPTTSYEALFITPHPRITVKWQALLYPFDLMVWLAVLGVIVALIPIYYMHFRYSHLYGPLDLSEALYESIAMSFAMLLLVCDSIPRRAKLLTVFYFFFSLLISNYYNCNLMSFLTFPEVDRLPTTVQELADARDKLNISLLTLVGNVYHSYLIQTSNPNAVKIREVIHWNRDWHGCIQNAATVPNYVCLTDDMFATYVGAKNLTLHSTFKPFVQSKETLVTVMMPVATAWNSRYYSVLNRNTGRFFDTGHYLKWRRDAVNAAYVNSRPWMQEQVANKTPLIRALTRAMVDADYSAVKPFTVDNFVLSFGALIVGLTVSLGVWLGERALKVFKDRPDLLSRVQLMSVLK